MARYDSEGYRKDGRRQTLGYSRLAQGGADQARARAEERVAMSRDPSLMNAQRRSRRVAEAKAEGTFNNTRDAYNEEGQDAGVEMDNSGNIRKKTMVNVGYTGDTAYTPKKPARAEPMSMARPISQRLDAIGSEAAGMATAGGLAEMARRARVRGTKVART
jgi:hypothetical protein